MATTTPTSPILRSLYHKPTLFNNSFHTSLPLKSLLLPPPPLLSLFSPSSRTKPPHVSTVPLEYAPPAPESFNFRQEISRLNSLRRNLTRSTSLDDKHAVLNDDSRVKHFVSGELARALASLNLVPKDLFLLKCLVAAGQQHVLNVGGLELLECEEAQHHVRRRSSVKSALYTLALMIERFDLTDNSGRQGLKQAEVQELNKLLATLREMDRFYDCIGGIIGYQIIALELLAHSTPEKYTTNWSQTIQETMECQFLEIHVPGGLDLSKNTEYASQAALWGIEGLPDLGEIYPLGGSGDRLGLVDPDTGECLPAAMLPYCGRTLLEGLIRDLQAREYLYFMIYGKQCITPVAIMTSSAKDNHKRITSLCERLNWFGRGQSSFQLFEQVLWFENYEDMIQFSSFFFVQVLSLFSYKYHLSITQPLVPAVSAEDGQWLLTKQFAPVCKPGGHGVIWKLAYDKGIFDWFYNHGRRGATVRQVSNVVAATDLTLLALAGIGLRLGKKLGFASCKRNSGATEGINALIEKKNLDGQWAYGLSCIEYTEFDKFGIPSGPHSPNGLQAQFPANTNILYVDLPSVELAASRNREKSLPGMVLNTKKPVVYTDQFGNYHSVSGGRLECTMQNIADNFLNTYLSRGYQGVEEKLDTFIVYNERRRVTSSAKRKRRHTDKSLHQTPDGSLLDILRNSYDLLSHCDIELPEVENNEKYVDSGPPFLILLHPALGPLWEVTRQKFNRGSIAKGSELQIEVAEFLWSNVQLDGSMIIVADNIIGSTRINGNGEPILQYGHRCGRCKLKNVKVLNKGIDWSFEDNIYWKHHVQRFEALKVILQGNAEFEAENVTIQGNHVFEVPDGYKMKITSGDPGLEFQLSPIDPNMMDSGSWYWKYEINGAHIQLELIEL